MKVNTNFLHSLSKEKYLSYIRALPNFHDEKVQSYATVILTLVAVTFFGIFAISPTLGTIAELRKSLDDSKFLDTQLQTKIEHMTELQSAYTSVTPQLPLIYAAVPQNPEVGKLAGQVRTLANSAGVSLDQLQMQSTEIASATRSKSILQPIIMNIGVKGDIQNFQTFYESLLTFDRLITISSLSLVIPSELNTAKYRLVVQAKAYYKP